MLLRIVATVLALALASASPIAQSIQNDPVTPQPPQQVTLNICPQLSVRCVTEGDWLHPIGYLGKRPFCLEGIRCNQCDEEGNTWDCNREFKECHGKCEAYAPIPF